MPDNITDALATREANGFGRSMAELQWLLLIIVMLYFLVPTGPLGNVDNIIAAMVGYSLFILLFRYFAFRLHETRIKLAIETWAMTAFITVILWNTGYTESPLLNLYLLVIIACAITLGRVMTLLEVLLVACCYLYMGFEHYSAGLFSAETFTLLMARFSPFLLVAFVTSMLASDILSAKNRVTLLSQKDAITGLLNMRAFSLMLEKQLNSAARCREPFSILIMDVDRQKDTDIRDEHSAGSHLLQTVSRTLKYCIRPNDIVAHHGNGEFVFLLPHTTAEQAFHYAEHLRTAVSGVSFEADGKTLKASASIGIAGFPGNVDDPAMVLGRADEALYRGKQEGHNRITLYTADGEAPASYPVLNDFHARQFV